MNLSEHIQNRNQFRHAELRVYENQHVAWSLDGRRILDGDRDPLRLVARLQTMPVIEQAKGIVMAQRQCGPDEAFDLLRRASQSANIKVSVLAERIVEQAAARDSRPGREPSTVRVNGGARRAALRPPR